MEVRSITNKEGEEVDIYGDGDFAIRTYLIFLVGSTIFTQKNVSYTYLVYLEYFIDLDMVDDYTWSITVLLNLYIELNVTRKI